MNWYRSLFVSLFPWFFKQRPRTVRYAFPFFFILVAAALGATVALTTDETYIIIEAPESRVKAGENFEIDVYVVASVPVNAIDISVDLPVEQVKVLGVDTGESVITLWTTEPYAKGGTVHLSGGTYRRGFVGKHLVATINGQALTSGIATIATINAELYAGDGTGSKVEIASGDTESTRLLIADENGAHEPGSIEGDAQFRIVGDIDGDGEVSLSDISMFMSAWRDSSVAYDLDGDSSMTFRDFGIILAKWFLRGV